MTIAQSWRRALFGTLLGLVALLIGGAASAAELAAPSGPVVLTVAGEVGQTNRPAFDPFRDAFLNYHDKGFERAAAFDRAMLQALGIQTITIDYAGWPGVMRFEGPWLRDLLAAAGAAGRPVTVLALDGYAIEISAEEIATLPWMVALKANGRDLATGGHGPTWVLYQPDGPATDEDEARWGWAVFFIEVE
ncbi:MAG: hypothetical protein ACFCUQ_02615 [Kiloniellales bacterium]